MAQGRLMRSRRNRVLGGVCGGLAEYFDFTPTGMRILYVFLSVCSSAFPGILVYLILWILLPLNDGESRFD